jgi:hypothetical protein
MWSARPSRRRSKPQQLQMTPTISQPVTQLEIQHWRSAVVRGRDWLAAQVELTPPFGQENADINWYAKLPWPLLVAGRRRAAICALNAVDRQLELGTLHDVRQNDWTNAVPYALGWLTTGAIACERYDSARRLYAELNRFVCPATGGLYSVIPQSRSEPLYSEALYFDVGIQGALLHAAVAIGDLTAACRAAGLMERWFDEQPDRRLGLFMQFHPQRGYLQDVREAARIQLMFAPGGERQPWANLGFVLQGLLRVSAATGEARYLNAARRILEHLLEVYRDDLLGHSQNHKVAHAAVVLYRNTGETLFFETAVTIARRIADNIHADGRALADVFFSDIAAQPNYVAVRTTCDSILWLQCLCDEIEFVERTKTAKPA